MKRYLLNFSIMVLLVFLLVPIIWPLLSSGYFRSDDGDSMVVRLIAFHETVKTHQFPIRFLEHLNHGFGYPVLNFLYPLPFYLGEVVHLLGFNFIDSIKILFLLSFLLGSFGMYFWLKRSYGTLPGLIAALTYAYFPYRTYDVFGRGSLGESTAFIFLPFIFLFADKLAQRPNFRHLGLVSLLYAALLTAHNSLAFLFTPVILLYLFLQLKTAHNFKTSFITSLTVVVLSLGLSAFFWLPAVFDLRYTRAIVTEVSIYQRYFLDADHWKQILGVTPFLILLTLVIHIIRVRRVSQSVLLWVAVFLVGLVFSTSYSDLLWKLLPLPRLVQFPWRFLSLTTFSGTVLLGYVASKIRNKLVIVLTLAAILVVSLQSFSVDKTYYPEGYYRNNDSTSTVQNEYLPRWVKNEFLSARPQLLEVTSGRGTVIGSNAVNLETPGNIRINKVYFPGWQVKVDGLIAKIDYEKEGFLDITVPSGKHSVRATFFETPLRAAADGISLVGFLVVFCLLLWGRKLSF